MLLITKVGSPTLGLRAPALGACGGAFGFLAFGFLAVAALLELAGLAAGAESGRIGRGEAGRAIGLAVGLVDMDKGLDPTSKGEVEKKRLTPQGCRVRVRMRVRVRVRGAAGAPMVIISAGVMLARRSCW